MILIILLHSDLIPNDPPTWQNIIGGIGVFLTIAGVVFAVIQFRSAQKWKRLEYAAQQMNRLFSDPKLEACCVFLDWKTRTFNVPPQYKASVNEDHFIHSWSALGSAMVRWEENSIEQPEILGSKTKAGYNWQEVMYRDYFDYFFEFLGSMRSSVGSGLLTPKDILPLKYWVILIKETHGQLFENFVKDYRYDQTIEDLYLMLKD